MKKENEKRVLTDEQYESLLVKFMVNPKHAERQVTTYYSAKDKNSKDIDLRLMQTVGYTKVWMKRGKMHEYNRDEFDEFKIIPEYTHNAMEIFDCLYNVKTKWFIERIEIRKQPYIICNEKYINYVSSWNKLVFPKDETQWLLHNRDEC